jgi:hypothetical protein
MFKRQLNMHTTKLVHKHRNLYTRNSRARLHGRPPEALRRHADFHLLYISRLLMPNEIVHGIKKIGLPHRGVDRWNPAISLMSGKPMKFSIKLCMHAYVYFQVLLKLHSIRLACGETGPVPIVVAEVTFYNRGSI